MQLLVGIPLEMVHGFLRVRSMWYENRKFYRIRVGWHDLYSGRRRWWMHGFDRHSKHRSRWRFWRSLRPSHGIHGQYYHQF